MTVSPRTLPGSDWPQRMLLDLFNDDIARDFERLTRLAAELGLKAGRHGCTVSDLRIAAVNRGILVGDESAARMKQLNLGAVMRAAGLCATKQYRRSDVGRAKRNLNVVWTIQEFAEVA